MLYLVPASVAARNDVYRGSSKSARRSVDEDNRIRINNSNQSGNNIGDDDRA